VSGLPTQDPTAFIGSLGSRCVAQTQHIMDFPLRRPRGYDNAYRRKSFSNSTLEKTHSSSAVCTLFAPIRVVGLGVLVCYSSFFLGGVPFMKLYSRIWVAASIAAIALPSVASAQLWTNWTSGTGVGGTINGNIFGVSVTVTGNTSGYQLSDGTEVGTWFQAGQQYWTPSNAFTQSGLSAPTGFGIVQTDRQGVTNVAFGNLGAVINPYIAVNSLGRAGITTSITFSGMGATLLSSNNAGAPAYWNGGSCTLVGQTLTGAECSGIIQLSGTYTSLTMTSNEPNEYWDGFTIGAESVVPEPSTYVLFASGLAGLGLIARRRRSV
jgi:hypothetical protein